MVLLIDRIFLQDEIIVQRSAFVIVSPRGEKQKFGYVGLKFDEYCYPRRFHSFIVFICFIFQIGRDDF